MPSYYPIPGEHRDLTKLVGLTVKSVECLGFEHIKMAFTDGTEFHTVEGDAGTLRSPEPYFSFYILPPKRA